MDINEYVRFQSSQEGIEEINLLWKKILAKALKKTDVYLEWLGIRIFFAIGGYQNRSEDIFCLKLNDFDPVSCAPGKKPDVTLVYQKNPIICEITQRPIPGKIEHFQHLKVAEEEYGVTFDGILISQIKLNAIPGESWNIYVSHYQTTNQLFMICDFDLLITLLNKNASNGFTEWMSFIKKSKKIWVDNKKWDVIRKKIISLKEDYI